MRRSVVFLTIKVAATPLPPTPTPTPTPPSPSTPPNALTLDTAVVVPIVIVVVVVFVCALCARNDALAAALCVALAAVAVIAVVPMDNVCPLVVKLRAKVGGGSKAQEPKVCLGTLACDRNKVGASAAATPFKLLAMQLLLPLTPVAVAVFGKPVMLVAPPSGWCM